MHFNLVFEGGGAKGLVFVGAMQEFERRGHTYGRLLGTSAGAITAVLLAAGYRADEIRAQVNEKLPDGTPRFATFMDVADSIAVQDWENSLLFKLFQQIDWPFIPDVAERKMDDRVFKQFMKLKAYRLIFTFLELGGLYAGDVFLKWLREKMNLDGRNLGQATLGRIPRTNRQRPQCRRLQHDRRRHPGAQSPHRPQLPGCLGGAHVDEHPFHLARSPLAGRLGRI